MRNENRYIFPKESLNLLLKTMSNSGLENINHANTITQTIYFDRSSLPSNMVYLRVRSYLSSFSGHTLIIHPELGYQLEFKMDGQAKVSAVVDTEKLISAISGVGLLSIGLQNQFKLVPTGATEWLRQHFKYSGKNEERRITLDIIRRYYIFNKQRVGEFTYEDKLIRVECKEPNGETQLSNLVKNVPSGSQVIEFTEQMLKRK